MQAAKELQEAMDSGDAQVLMNAIDNAKLHQVNQEAGDSDRKTADRFCGIPAGYSSYQ